MKFVIFHGAYGNAKGNWFPWLKTELIKLKQEVILEQFPVEDWNEVEKTGPKFVPTNQTLDNWYKFFEKVIMPRIKPDDKLCFVGHSLGPQFILHAVDRFNLHLDSAIFVMPFGRLLKPEHWKFNVVNSSFMPARFNYSELKKHIPLSYALYTDNDLYVQPELSRQFASQMKSNEICVRGGRHINGPFFTKQNLVLELCKSRLEASEYKH